MNNSIRKTITGLAVIGVATAGLAATAAPASAQTIKAHGTVTRAEANKMHRAVDRQNCFTSHEARKMAGARGTFYDDGNFETAVVFKGKSKSSVQAVTVWFWYDCAYFIESDLTRDRWQWTYNQQNEPFDFEEENVEEV